MRVCQNAGIVTILDLDAGYTGVGIWRKIHEAVCFDLHTFPKACCTVIKVLNPGLALTW